MLPDESTINAKSTTALQPAGRVGPSVGEVGTEVVVRAAC